MSNLNRLPKAWAGQYLMAVAFLHTIAAAWMFSGPLLDIAGRGVFNSVQGDPAKGRAAWFVLFGAALALLALALTALERQGDSKTLRALGIGLLLLSVTGVVLMPASGFWLAMPPAIALWMRQDAAAPEPLRGSAGPRTDA